MDRIYGYYREPHLESGTILPGRMKKFSYIFENKLHWFRNAFESKNNFNKLLMFVSRIKCGTMKHAINKLLDVLESIKRDDVVFS